MDEDLEKLLKNKMKPVNFKELRSPIIKSARKTTLSDVFEASNEIHRKIEYAAGNLIITDALTSHSLPLEEGIIQSKKEYFGLVHTHKWERFNVLIDVDADYSGFIVTYTDNFTEGFVNPAKRDFYAYVEGATNA